MAVRREQVILELVDDFTAKAARAAAAAQMLGDSVDKIGSSSSGATKETDGLSKSTEQVRKSSESASTSVGRLASTLNKQTGATTLSTRAMVAKTLADRGALDAAEKLGVSVKDVTDAALGNHDALSRMNGSLTATRTRLQETGASTAKFDTDAQKLVGSVSRMSTEMSTAQSRVKLLSSAIGDLKPKTESGGKSLDKYSGRLGLLADAAIVLGPALVPLGASTIPVLTGALVGLGAAAGGIGVTVLALHGIGEGLKAIDAYNLDPTVANLKKLRLEEQKLGPAGMQFAQQLSNLEPLLKSLQTTAQQRMFPGLEAGITDILARAPEVQKIIARLADGMGELARDAGASLSSAAWTPFFDYLKTDAEPTLLAFGRATGNVVLGLSQMLVAFAPMSRGFASGLEDMAKSFANWSAHLDTNQSFQSFLAYIRESTPQVLALLGSLATTFASIARAAAPVGHDVLPVFTDLVKVLGVVAASPFGAALVTGLVALRAYVRAVQLATLTTKAFGDASGAAGVNLNTMGGKARFAVTSLIGLEVAGQVLDGIAKSAAGAAPDIEKLAAALISADQSQVNSSLGVNLKDTLASLDPSGVDGLATSFENLGAKGGAAGKALALGLGGFVGLQPKMIQASITTQKATQTFQSLDAALTEIATTGGPEKAQAAFKALADAQGLSAAQQKAVLSHLPQFSAALQRSANTAKLTAVSLHQVSAAAAAAKADVVQLNDALSALAGWFDKRQAMRDYEASLKALTKSLKNGLQPKDVEKIDAVGQSMLQVANSIKDPKLQRDFLAGARASLEKLANGAGPKAKAAVDKVIGAMDRFGATAPVAKLGADDRRAKNAITGATRDLKTYGSTTTTSTLNADGTPAKRTISGVDGLMASLAHKNVNPHISVDPGNSFSILGSIKAQIASIRDKTVTIRTVHTGGFGPQPAADGAAVPKSGLPYADRYLYMLADGEQIISNRYGQADRFRADSAAGRIPGYADGGTTGGHSGGSGGGGHSYTDLLPADLIHDLGGAAHVASLSLHEFVKQMSELDKQLTRKLNRDEKELKKAQTADQTAHSNLDSLSSTIASSLGLDSIYTKSQASSTPWMAGASGGSFNIAGNANKVAATANTFVANIKALQAKGVTGAALQALISQGPEVLAAVAAMSASDLSSTVSAITAASAAVATASSYGGSAVFGGQVASADKHLDAIRDEVRKLRQDVKAADAANKAGHKATTHAASTAGSNAAAAARRRGRGH